MNIFVWLFLLFTILATNFIFFAIFLFHLFYANMLVWLEDNLEEFCEGHCDLPPFFSFAALSLDNSLM